MCVVSMILDHYNDEWGKWVSPPQPNPYPVWPPLPWVIPPTISPTVPVQPILPLSKEDADEEFRRFYELYKRAKKYDEENHEKDCELASKKEAIRKLAQEIGIPADKIDGVLNG